MKPEIADQRRGHDIEAERSENAAQSLAGDHGRQDAVPLLRLALWVHAEAQAVKNILRLSSFLCAKRRQVRNRNITSAQSR
jgi:NADPH-dependent ferric siderophore reductase